MKRRGVRAVLSSTLLASITLWVSTVVVTVLSALQSHAQQFPSFHPEPFCPGQRAPLIKRRTCSAFHFLASCASIDGATCTVSMNSILDNIRADNATWDCTSTNAVQLGPGGVLCGSGGVPPCSALISLDSVDVECKAENFFKVREREKERESPPTNRVCLVTPLLMIRFTCPQRWLQGTGWLPLQQHFGRDLPSCVVNETAWPAYY